VNLSIQTKKSTNTILLYNTEPSQKSEANVVRLEAGIHVQAIPNACGTAIDHSIRPHAYATLHKCQCKAQGPGLDRALSALSVAELLLPH